MPKPEPKSIDPDRLVPLAKEVIEAARFPHLATMDDDQPRVRPVSPLKTDHFTVYIGNLRGYHKTVEIARNPKVELCYLDENHNQLRITGIAEVVSDRPTLEAIWNESPLLRQFLSSIDDPNLIIYRVVPNRVRYMQEWALEYYEVPLLEA